MPKSADEFLDLLKERYPGRDIKVIGYSARKIDIEDNRVLPNYSTKCNCTGVGTSLYYFKITTHINVDGFDIYATTGDGYCDSEKSAIDMVLNTIDKSMK